MKRCCYLLMLMLLSSSAYAGESYSFVVAGHRIHLEALPPPIPDPRNAGGAS